MKFIDHFSSNEDRYSIGIEESTKKHYISIPVFNGLVEYEEYYQITQNEFDQFLKEPELARKSAEKCRQGKNDENLIVQPGKRRGK